MLHIFILFLPIIMTVDAIVLKAIAYREDGKILQLFTKKNGRLSVFVKHLKKRSSFWQTATSPLARGHFHLIKKKESLYLLQDIHLIDSFIEIREDLHKLEAAFLLLRSLLLSQYPEKASVKMYQLTLAYLKKLKQVPYPKLLATSFQMKLLKHEGLFPEKSPGLSSHDWKILSLLCHVKRFDLLEPFQEIEPSLFQKGQNLFDKKIADYCL